MNIKYPIICALSFFRISIVIALAIPVVAQEMSIDPVSELLKEYKKFSVAGLSDTEKAAKYDMWRQKFIAAVKEYPASELKRRALLETVYICSLLGDNDQSLELLEEMLNEKSLSLWEQYNLQEQHAGVLSMMLLLNPSEDVCSKAIESYKKSNDLIDSLLKDTSSVPIFVTVTKEGEQITTPQKDWLLEKKINNFVQMGNRLIRFNDSIVLSRSAKNHFQQARKKLEELTPKKGTLATRNIGLEYVASNEALAAAYAGDMQDMEEALNFLNTLDNKEWPTSFYVEEIAQKAFVAKGKEPRVFLIQWIGQSGDDERTCMLVCQIVDSFMREKPDGYQSLVFPYVESLVEGKYAESLKKLEADGIKQGNSGNYAMMLEYLVDIYAAKEDYDKAIQYNNQLLEMFPNYGGLTDSAKKIASTLANRKVMKDYAESMNEPKYSISAIRLLFILVGICLCLYAVYRMWRERGGGD